MAENRIKREAEKRDTSTRKKAWHRPEVLPSPEPEPGYVFRWIRVSTLNTLDPSNISSKLREGWTPVRADDHPELQLLVTDANDKFKDNVVIGGLLLCKAPEELVQERNEYYEGQTKAQMDAVNNNFMRDNDPRMQKFAERKSEVTFGKGT